jgi:hypothetical protein
MKKIPFPLIALLFASALGHAESTVTVYSKSQTQPQVIKDAERLADLVTRPELSRSWWPGAVISERQASAAEEQKQQQLLARLGEVAADEGGDDGAAINGLRQQLSAIHVTGRQFVNLDPDWVRLRPQANVPLQGEYSLWTGPQPTTITLVGLVSSPGIKPFTPGRSVDEYLDDISLLSRAERSYAWVIYPNGKTEKAPVAYWNKRHIEPSPGSLIFVGFSDRLFSSTFDELNQQILNTLTHRIPD